MEHTNFDTQEIAKFERMAAQWWDPNGPCKPLHVINPVRVKYIEQITPIANKKIMDIGCGGGLLTEALAMLNAEVTGLDMSEEAINVAKSHAQKSNLKIHYHLNTAEAVAELQPAHYDIVTCMELLEHVPDPISLIKACAKLAKPDGHIFFSTINRNLKAYLFTIVGAEYLLKILPKGTHEYAKFIQPAELGDWARRSGLVTQQFKGISYNLLTKDFYLSDDISINYLAHCQHPI